MGTVFNQTPRMDNALCYTNQIADEIERLIKRYSITQETALEIIKTSIKIADFDAKDEQIAGIATIFESLVNTLDVVLDK